MLCSEAGITGINAHTLWHSSIDLLWRWPGLPISFSLDTGTEPRSTELDPRLTASLLRLFRFETSAKCSKAPCVCHTCWHPVRIRPSRTCGTWCSGSMGRILDFCLKGASRKPARVPRGSATNSSHCFKTLPDDAADGEPISQFSTYFETSLGSNIYFTYKCISRVMDIMLLFHLQLLCHLQSQTRSSCQHACLCLVWRASQ